MTKWEVFIEYLPFSQKVYCLEFDDTSIAEITERQYEEMKKLLSCQAENEKLKEENRWILASDLPKEYIKPSPSHPANWTKIYLILEYDDSIPRPMTAENIWLNEGSEVQWYKPIILPPKDN